MSEMRDKPLPSWGGGRGSKGEGYTRPSHTGTEPGGPVESGDGKLLPPMMPGCSSGRSVGEGVDDSGDGDE